MNDFIQIIIYLMFPDSNHYPASFSQSLGLPDISCTIIINLFYPPITICFWHTKMSWTAMPEAPINKYAYF